MGDVTRLAITGANGFVGRACVAEARRRNAAVIAYYRTAPDPAWSADDAITAVQVDLSAPDASEVLRATLADAQAVIHAAAHMGGDAAAHLGDTILPTTAVLDAMTTQRLVLVSSIAVYDTMALVPGAALTEECALETEDTARDSYTQAKLAQERLVNTARCPAWILRPGAIYGPGRTWHALMGFWASKLHVSIASAGQLPLVHVDHVAQSLVQAAHTPPDHNGPLNVVDDDLPTRAHFLTRHRALTGWPRLNISVPYGLWHAMTRLLSPVSRALPGLFREPILRARMMPLRYPNTALRAALGGQDTAPFDQMLTQSVKATS